MWVHLTPGVASACRDQDWGMWGEWKADAHHLGEALGEEWLGEGLISRSGLLAATVPHSLRYSSTVRLVGWFINLLLYRISISCYSSKRRICDFGLAEQTFILEF